MIGVDDMQKIAMFTMGIEWRIIMKQFEVENEIKEDLLEILVYMRV